MRRQGNPFLLAEGEGEESAYSDNDDEDYDDYGDDEEDGHGGYNSRHGADEASDSSYFEGGFHSHLHQSKVGRVRIMMVRMIHLYQRTWRKHL